MAYRVILLFISIILVTDVVARWGRNRRTCRGICKDKDDEVIATRRPWSNGKCVAFVCRNCRLKRQLISDCVSVHEKQIAESKEKTTCTYDGKPVPNGQIVDSNEGSSVCMKGKMIGIASLVSHFGAFVP